MARPVKVLISGGLAEGGVRTHIRLLCASLRECGAEVTVAAAATNWAAIHLEGLRQLGVVVRTTPWGFGRWSPLAKVQAVSTWPFLLRRDFDVLYCIGYGRMHLFLRRFLRQGGRAVYHEIVDAPAAQHPMVEVVARMHELIANSKPVAERWRALAPGLPVRSIPFLTEQWTPIRRQVGRAGERELRVVYLGRMVRHKRVDWLVREWPAIERAIGRARLDVHGADYEGERMLEPLRAEVQALGLEGRVTLHGGYDGRAALDAILASADLVVLPSLYEGLPLVLVEAMAAGVPIVATEAGGTRDLGEQNPDVVVTGVEQEAFLAGLTELARRVRAGLIDAERLRRWTRARYGPEVVTDAWRRALLGGAV